MPNEQQQPRREGFSAWWAVREVDHLFGKLGRYTRFVAYSKWSLLGVALVLTASLIAWPLLTKDRSGMRISFVDSKTATGEKPASPVMNDPEYNGIGEAGQQYKINGKSATQKTSTLVLIDAVEGQMLKPDGKWFSLTADRAEYQQDKKIIDLYGTVTVIDDQGTEFVTSHATIEMDTMHTYGNETITGSGPMGNILASGFEIGDNGNHIVFTRGDAPVKVKVDRAAKQK